MAVGTSSSQPRCSPHKRWSSIFGMMVAGEHHPRISNNLAILDINSRLVSFQAGQVVENLGLKVSVMTFHSTPNTFVKRCAYLIVHDDSSSRSCFAMLCSTAFSLVFHFLNSKPPSEKDPAILCEVELRLRWNLLQVVRRLCKMIPMLPSQPEGIPLDGLRRSASKPCLLRKTTHKHPSLVIR